MKQFFKSVFTHLFALCLFCGGIFALGLALVAGLAVNVEPTHTVEKGSVLMFDLGMNITDAPPGFDPGEVFAQIQGAHLPARMSLRAVVESIDAAAKDERISALHLSGNLISINYGSGYAALREVRQAIERFKDSGKPVSAYFLFADNKDYYLGSAANEVVLHPAGGLGVVGLGAQGVFWKGFFEKYGIGIEVVRAGKYKSFAETLSRQNYSPEEREQLTELLGGLWSEVVNTVAASRGIDTADFQRVVDSGEALGANAALEAKLVTRLAKEEEMLADLAEAAGKERTDLEFPKVSLQDYAVARRTAKDARKGDSSKEIAVVYAEGAIVDGDGEQGEVGANKMVDMLRDMQRDKDIKALVLRVNSPGGSGMASDRILEAIKPFREKGIPVVVSMGTVAASGGYYISMASDRIFVQPNTITGSIGVIGVLPNIEELATRQGITTDSVSTARFATTGSLLKKLQPEELAIFQRLIGEFYERFLGVVSEGRKLDRDAVHAVAQGRVWTGPAAIEHKLADELGGLQDAITYAARKADIESDYRVREYPRPQRFEEFLEDAFKTSQPAVRLLTPRSAHADPVSAGVRRIQAELKQLSQFDDPRGIYLRLPYDLALD